MIMVDHSKNTTFLVVPMSNSELLQAARLAGLEVHIQTDLKACSSDEVELMQDYARYGVLEAIRYSFEREFPPRYPDDCKDFPTDDTEISANLTGHFGDIWRGEVNGQ